MDRSVSSERYALSIPLVLTATAPISHNSDEKAGNQSLFRTVSVIAGGKPVTVPIVSGAALRGLLRRIACDVMLEDLDMSGWMLDRKLQGILRSGGSIEKGEVAKSFDSDLAKMVSEIPVLKVWGGTVQAQIKTGHLWVRLVVPVCAETYAARMQPIPSDLSAHQLYTEMHGVRHDDIELHVTGDKRKVQMIFNQELLAPGTRFVTEIGMRHSLSPWVPGFVERVVARWAEDPHVGGRRSVGFGTLAIETMPEPNHIGAYLEHIRTNGDRIREALVKLGARRPKEGEADDGILDTL